VLCGWVQRQRDHGGVIFIDLRDRSGLCQVVFRPEIDAQVHDRAQALRSEYVLAVRGRVAPRTPETLNPRMATGAVEIVASELRVLNTATTPPFAIEDDTLVDEAVRLRHACDLRRPAMQRRLGCGTACCSRAALQARTARDRDAHAGEGHAEGARLLVPSRMHPGYFFALPRSPQLLKRH
jgi:aspartyl-tRNA synthetase